MSAKYERDAAQDVARRVWDALNDDARAALAPIDRAYLLGAAGVPVSAWDEAALDAFCDESPALMAMSDDELDALTR